MDKIYVFNQKGGFVKETVEGFITSIEFYEIEITQFEDQAFVLYEEMYILVDDSFLIPEESDLSFDEIEESYFSSTEFRTDENIMKGIYLTALLIHKDMLTVKTIHPMILEVIEIIKKIENSGN